MTLLSQRNSVLNNYLIFILSITYAAIVLFPNFTAQWGLIDDHGIVTVLGSEFNLKLSHIPHVIANVPEIGHVGHYPRFQPVYILLHLAEAFFFGGSPFLFYVFRVLLFGLTVGVFTLLFVEIFGVAGGSLLGVAFAAHQFWGDIWARLGPAEIYAAPLLAIYCFSFWRLWTGHQKKTFWYFALFLAGIFLLGTKENLIFIIPVTAILLVYDWRQRLLNYLHLFLGLGVICFGLFVVWAIWSGLGANGGNDFYGTPVSAIYRLKMVLVSITSFANWRVEPPALIPLIISSLLLGWAWLSGRQKTGSRVIGSIKDTSVNVLSLWWCQIYLFLLWSLQVVFYFKRNIPRGEHYDFPGVLFVDVAYFLLFFSCIKIISNWLRTKGKDGTGFVKISFLIIVISMCFMRFSDVKQIYVKAQDNSRVTQQFTKKLKYIVNEVSKAPSVPIVIESHWIWDYEPIGGLRRYLSVYGVKNPLVVKIVGYSAKTVEAGHQKDLAKEMSARSLNGDYSVDDRLAPEGTTMLPYSPLSMVDLNGDCFVVSFSGDSDLGCKPLGRIYF